MSAKAVAVIVTLLCVAGGALALIGAGGGDKATASHREPRGPGRAARDRAQAGPSLRRVGHGPTRPGHRG